MKIHFLALLFLYLAISANGQDYYSKTFDFGEKRNEIIWSFEKHNENVYASVGYSCDSVPCSYGASIDSEDGAFVWKKLIPWMDPNGRGITKNDEHLFFAGHNLLDSNQYVIYHSSFEGDSLGLYHYSAHENFYFPETGAVNSIDSLLILVGTARDSLLIPEKIAIALWIKNNEIVDSMSFAPGNFSNVIFQIQGSLEGDIYFFIQHNNLNPSNNLRYQILKFNSERELIWQWDSPEDMILKGQQPPRFLVHSNGNIYMTADPRPDGLPGIWILKPGGTLEFTVMPDVANLRYTLTRLKEDSNGNIMGCGFVSGVILPANVNYGYYFKIDSSGNFIWERIIDENVNLQFGENSNAVISDMVELNNGDLILGGGKTVWYYDNNNMPDDNNDAWLVRTNSEGCILEDCGYIQDLVTSTSAPKAPSPFIVFPNPTNGRLYFSSKEDSRIKSIEVYNNLGQRLSDTPAVHSNYIDLSVFSNGLLYLIITDEDGRSWAEPVLVE